MATVTASADFDKQQSMVIVGDQVYFAHLALILSRENYQTIGLQKVGAAPFKFVTTKHFPDSSR